MIGKYHFLTKDQTRAMKEKRFLRTSNFCRGQTKIHDARERVEAKCTVDLLIL